MKFKNPATGEVYDTSVDDCARSGFCKTTVCRICPIYRIVGNGSCNKWVNANPEKAAELMGYEWLDDPAKLVGPTGPVGQRGMPGVCPRCGSTAVDWDSQTDVSHCTDCGWSNAGEGVPGEPEQLMQNFVIFRNLCEALGRCVIDGLEPPEEWVAEGKRLRKYLRNKGEAYAK